MTTQNMNTLINHKKTEVISKVVRDRISPPQKNTIFVAIWALFTLTCKVEEGPQSGGPQGIAPIKTL